MKRIRWVSSGGVLGAGLLAMAFGLLAAGVAAALVTPLPASATRALQGLSPSAAVACLLIAMRLAVPAAPRYRNLFACAAALAAVVPHLPFAAFSDLAGGIPVLGLPAPLVAAGLVFAALSLIAERRRSVLSMREALLRSLPLVALTLIGLLGLVSGAAGLRASGTWLPWLAVGPVPALAFLGLAIWSIRRRAALWLPAMRNDDRITLLTFLVLTLLVTVTGFATFWAVQSRLQDSEQERLVQSAYRREMAFNYQLDSAGRFAAELAQRPSIARALLAWPQQPQSSAAVLREEMEAAWNDDLTAIRFELAGSAEPLPSRGTVLPSEMPPVSLEQADERQFELQWNEGMLSLVRMPVVHAGGTVGWIVLQQRLQLLTEQLFETADLGPDVEVKLCYPASASMAACMPTGPQASSTRVPLHQGGEGTAVALGIRGAQGSMLTADLDGTGVIDVYASVRRPLALRLRQSIDSVMAPVRDKLKQVMLVVALLLAAGVTTLSLQVRPLASRLVASEREAREAQARAGANEEHLRTVMDNVADGIVTTDVRGRVTYLNQAAESMTGWKSAQAMGRLASDVYAVVATADGKPVPDLVAKALAGGAASRGELEVDLIRQGDGARIAVADRVSRVRHPGGDLAGTVLVFHDVTAERERTAAISHEATHDALTGLANRKMLERRLAAAADTVAEPPAHLHSVLFIDLDKFKRVNDTAGHEAGDHLLKQVTEVMQKCLRATDLFARVGGDEFAVLLSACGPDDALRLAQAMCEAVAAFEFHWHGAMFKVGTSIGVATFEGGFGDMAEIVRHADAACYRAKHAGRGNVKVHEDVLLRGTGSGSGSGSGAGASAEADADVA